MRDLVIPTFRSAFLSLTGLIMAACLTAIQAMADPVQPEGLPAAPGQYSGYLDWLAKTTFTKKDMPDEVVNDYVQCAYKALYDIMTPLEHDMLDKAARGNGMTAPELRAFERAVADRMDDGEATERILSVCKAPYERFLTLKPASDG
jgi:hypothetical protein